MSGTASSPARPRSPGSVRRNSPRSPGVVSCASPSRPWVWRSRMRGSSRPRWRGWSRSPRTRIPRSRSPAASGMGELTFFSRIHYGGGAACATMQQAAMAVATGSRGCRGLLPGVQRAIGRPVRHRCPGSCSYRRRRRRRTSPGTRPRAAHTGELGGDVRAALPARHRGDDRGLRPGRGRRPEARGHEPGGLVLRKADNPRGAPGLAVDRRTDEAARLLPGDRRGPGDRGDSVERARDLPSTTGRHRGRGPGGGTSRT